MFFPSLPAFLHSSEWQHSIAVPATHLPLHGLPPPLQNKYAAQRALLRSGDRLSHSVMVGVVPLTGAHRQAVERYLASGSRAGGNGGALPFPKPPAMRPYLINANSTQVNS